MERRKREGGRVMTGKREESEKGRAVGRERKTGGEEGEKEEGRRGQI